MKKKGNFNKIEMYWQWVISNALNTEKGEFKNEEGEKKVNSLLLCEQWKHGVFLSGG